MAQSCALVVYNAGGVDEWLSEGVTGLRVSLGDARAPAPAIRRLRQNPALAQQFGEEGYSCVLRRFHKSGFLSQLIEIY